MLRFRRFAAVAVVLSPALAGCSDSGSGLFQSSPPPTVSLQFDSEPPGAQVRTAQGQTCQTPCALPVPAASQSVTFEMNGYMPQTIQISTRAPADHSLFSTSPPDLVPNPVGVTLQAVAPPPRKPPARPRPHRAVAKLARPAAPAPAAAAPTAAAPAAPATTGAQGDGFPPPPTWPAPSSFPPQPPNTQ